MITVEASGVITSGQDVDDLLGAGSLTDLTGYTVVTRWSFDTDNMPDASDGDYGGRTDNWLFGDVELGSVGDAASEAAVLADADSGSDHLRIMDGSATGDGDSYAIHSENWLGDSSSPELTFASSATIHDNIVDFISGLDAGQEFDWSALDSTDFSASGSFMLGAGGSTAEANYSISSMTAFIDPLTPPASVIEPGSLALLGLGIAGLGAARRRQR